MKTETETRYHVLLVGNGGLPNTKNMEVDEFKASSDEEAIEIVKARYLENHRRDWCYAYGNVRLTRETIEVKVVSREEIEVAV